MNGLGFPARKLFVNRLWISRHLNATVLPDGTNGTCLRGCVGAWVRGADDVWRSGRDGGDASYLPSLSGGQAHPGANDAKQLS